MEGVFRTLAELNKIDMMLFRMIATSQEAISRSGLAARTGLSKMTISRHIVDMIQKGLVIEREEVRSGRGENGRIPASLHISDACPCICGILIKRNYVQMVISDITGHILDMLKKHYEEEMSAKKLKSLILSMYDKLIFRSKRAIMGCGVAAIGPIDSEKGILLNPPDFFGITAFPIVDIVHAHTGLPVFLLHDAAAGAIAERMYGRRGSLDQFIYLHVEDGIGLCYIWDGRLVQGGDGYSGEIGHTSINFGGPKCSCGKYGCLEVYANLNQMRKTVAEALPFVVRSELRNIREPSWRDIVNQAVRGDMVGISAVNEYCTYLTYALSNLLSLVYFPVIILGSDSAKTAAFITQVVKKRMKETNEPLYERVKIYASEFQNAPLVGAVAVVAKNLFDELD